MSRVAYIVLTCRKYVPTRMVWQKETVFSKTGLADVFYLGHEMKVEDRLYSWGARDDYDSLPYKFADFFRCSELNYDWYFLMDDDTYVYTEKLQERIREIEDVDMVNPRQDPYMEGRILTHISHTEWGVYHSGGAGTLLSAKVYDEVRQMFDGVTGEYRSPHFCADICLGLWTKGIPGIRIVDSDRYHTGMAVPSSSKDAITFHHLTTEVEYWAHRVRALS